MSRRILKNGLLATVAVFAFLPTAGAATASAATPIPAPQGIVQYYNYTTLPAPVARPHHRHYGYRSVGRVTTHHVRLNVRSGPGTRYRVVGHRHSNRLVPVTCKAYGGSVRGNHTWYRLPHREGYVAARYVRVGHAVPWC
ncbi:MULTISPECIES: SH3 domain-containing protein [Streptomyces]|uniref:SH3 domain-containing protein n=1 Tax=Streptomyces arenae TaxID=29301 RepID=UPI001055C271|nr:SH3 domain-containing protein [Streptomyces arenae]MCG7208318.1 SH3 domain-containing protein [Streptomyces arenae]